MARESDFSALAGRVKVSIPHQAPPEVKQLADLVSELARLCAAQAREIEELKRRKVIGP